MALTLLSRVNKNTKLFDTGLGNGARVYRCHAGNIHYPDSSQIWQDIDTTLLSKTGGKYQNKCFYSCEVPELSTGVFTWFNGDHFFSFKLKDPVSVGYIPTPDIWGTLGKGWRYPNCFGTGVHFEVYAKNSYMDHRIVWDKAPADITVDQIFDFEIVQFPTGINIRDINTTSGVTYDLTKAARDAVEVTEKVIAIFDSANNGLYTSYISNPRAYNTGGTISLPVRMIFYRAQGKGWFRKIVPRELFQKAVYPVFADHPTGYYAGSGNGRIYKQGTSATWDALHNAADGSGVTTDQITAGTLISGTTYYLIRGFIPIDTSAISTADTITNAVLNLRSYEKGDATNDAYDYLSICHASKPATPTTALVVGDYDLCDSVHSPTEGHETSERKDLTALSISAYTSWTLNATGIGWIGKGTGGQVLFGMRLGHDMVDNSAANGTNTYARFRASEATGTSEDPYVEVTIVSAARTDRFFQMF